MFQAYYEQYALRSDSSSTISWIGSLQLCLFIGGAFLAGPLFDIGYLTPMLIFGTVLTVLGLMMTSICSQYWQFLLAQGVCTGLGMSGLITPCVAVVPPYFSSKRALAMGIAATGSSLGQVSMAHLRTSTDCACRCHHLHHRFRATSDPRRLRLGNPDDRLHRTRIASTTRGHHAKALPSLAASRHH